jgi:hypothetical protein
VDAKNAADANCVKTSVVDQTPDRLRMNAQLSGDVSDAVEILRLRVDRRHVRHKLYTVGAFLP